MSSNQPWLNEPDAYDWTDEDTGLPCAIRRNEITGTLNGYVGVPDDHPWHGRDYTDRVPSADVLSSRGPVSLEQVGVFNIFREAVDPSPPGHAQLTLLVDCHGGLTYADWTLPILPDLQRSFWWFGFDCGHAGDLAPSLLEVPKFIKLALPDVAWPGSYGVYRTFEFVMLNCQSLAADLAVPYAGSKRPSAGS